MKFKPAPDVQIQIHNLVFGLNLSHVLADKLVCMRSWGSKSRAVARIWSLPRVWQQALGVSPHYVIEVISERFDRMSDEEKEKILIHELLHVPKTFSGSLVPHKCFGKKIDRRRVDELYRDYKSKLRLQREN